MRRGRRALVAAITAGALSLTAAACGGYGGNSKNRLVSSSNVPSCPLTALDDATGTINVSLWHGWTAQPQVALNNAASAFNAAQDQAFSSGQQKYRIHVSPTQEGKDYDEVFDKYARAASSKQLPAIVQLEDNKILTIADSGTVLPAQACMKADGFDMSSIQPAVRTYYTVRNVFWPGFLAASEPVLYYNKTHFVRAGLDPDKPPGTLDELYADAKRLKAAGVNHPLALKLDPWFLTTWLSGIGEDAVDHDNGRSGEARKATFDTKQLRDLMAFFKKMQNEDLVEVVPKTAGNINQYLALATQKSSMVMETSAAATTIAAFLQGSATGVGAPVTDLKGLVPADGPFPGIKKPGQVQASGAAMYIVSTQAPKVQAASWEFLKFMLSKDQMAAWHITSSYLPIASGAATSPSVLRFWASNNAGRLLAPVYLSLAAADPSKPGPSIGPYGEYFGALQTAWEQVMFSNADPGHALAGAQATVTKALQQYHDDNG